MFESIIGETDSKFKLGKEKAGDLLAAVTDLINRKGFAEFFAGFENAGLGDLASSWVGRDANTPISNEQLESALGEDTLKNFADKSGTDYKTATSAAAFIIPHVVDELTPTGKMPENADLTAMLGGSLPKPPSVIAGEPFDRMDASVSSAAIDDFDGDNLANENPVLKWFLPLIILAIMIVLGFWFCGKSTPVASNVSTTNTNTTANTNTAK